MPRSDTHPDARTAQIEALRRLGPGRRLAQAFEMSEQARELSIAGRLARAPGMTRSEARAELLRRMLGDELYEAAHRGKAE